jgi:hypothetical protein
MPDWRSPDPEFHPHCSRQDALSPAGILIWTHIGVCKVESCYPACAVRHQRNKIHSYDVIPEIFEMLKERGTMRTGSVKDEMVTVADQKKLVYNDDAVTRALAILKWHNLAMNAERGFWSARSEESEHLRITAAQARELATLRCKR